MVSEKIPITKLEEHNFKGIFKTKEIHNLIRDFFLKKRGYGEIVSKIYKEETIKDKKKIYQKCEVRKDYTDYYRIIIYYNLTIEGKETQIETEKITTNVMEGEIKLQTMSAIEPNISEKRPKISSLHHFISQIFEHYFSKDELEKCKETIKKDLKDLISTIKNHLGSPTKWKPKKQADWQ